jgi:hypothetical protein
MTPLRDPAFSRWLTDTTRGLAKPTAAEVQAEFEAHYQDACAAYEAEGHSPSSAQAAALADLGDARTVQRMLRRVHLSRMKRLIGWVNWLTPHLWQHRALIATALFGLLALVVVVGDHRHWISYRGHLDLLTPIALAFVIASLVLERKLAIWSYPAAGYLLTGIWAWLLFSFGTHLNGPLWNILAPLLLPPTVIIALSVIALRSWRRDVGRQIPAGAWLIVALIPIVIAGTTFIQLSGDGVVFRTSDLAGRHWLANVPWGIFSMVMVIAPVAIGLLAAARQGIFAALIPLGAHFALFVAIADPTYHPTFYDGIWQTARTLGTLEATMISLPALALFLVTPLWMLQARTTKERAIAAWAPAVIVLALANAYGAAGLQQVNTPGPAAMITNTLLMSLRALLPVLLAVTLYRRGPSGIEDPSPAELELDVPLDSSNRRLERRRLT